MFSAVVLVIARPPTPAAVAGPAGSADSVLALLGGAAAAALIGLLGAWIQGRREHRRWLRERRYDAYLRFLQLIDRDRMWGAIRDPDAFRDAASEIALLGPYSLIELTSVYFQALTSKAAAGADLSSDDQLIGLRQDLIIHAQRRLGIRTRGGTA